MKYPRLRLLALTALVLGCFLVPVPAHAEVGSTIVGRFWDSFLSTTTNRMQQQTPNTVALLQQAENVFLGQTEDVTTMSAIRDVYKGMRVAGLMLLGLCTVISLAEVTEAGMLGQSSSLTEWVKRFCTATFMTMGSIYFYGLWIRIFNALLAGFRQYLDIHWSGATDSTVLYTQLLQFLKGDNTMLVLLFGAITIIVLFVLWFLIGGVRLAELALAVIIAPLVWPVYLIPSLEDIPKTAFRSFLGLNAVLLIIVAMVRLAVRMVVSGGGAMTDTIWNFVPALSLLMLAIFLPSMVKRIVGQGNTGAGLVSTVGYALAGLKGISMLSGSAATAARPPSAAAVPQAPSGASAYPLASVPPSSATTAGSQAPNVPEHVYARAPRQLGAGMQAAGAPALGEPYIPKASDWVFEMGQSKPGSNQWDIVTSLHAYRDGEESLAKPIKPE
ncbi:MAG TPA: hypothetical protein VGK74_13170 [Symbiobacteriaceae bacterium]|jgi:hypothetical protein